MLVTVILLPGATLLGHVLFLVAISANASPLASTSSPQQLYQAYLESLSGPQELGTTRAPYRKVPQYQEGSFEAALPAGMSLYIERHLFITVYGMLVFLNYGTLANPFQLYRIQSHLS